MRRKYSSAATSGTPSTAPHSRARSSRRRTTRGARSGKSIQARPLIWAGYMRRPPHARTGEGMKFTRASTSEHLPDGPSASVLPSSPAMSCCTACGPGVNDINPVSAKFYKNYIAKYREEPATYLRRSPIQPSISSLKASRLLEPRRPAPCQGA